MGGPARGLALGGIAFGTTVLVVGILIFLADQRILNITVGFWTVCSLALIVVGILAIGGTFWARRFAGGGWRRWIEDWDREA